MARVTAYEALNMIDFGFSLGTTVFADEDLLVVSDGFEDTYYFGDFSYPNNEWKGTIRKVQVYNSDELTVSVTGIDLATRYATVGSTAGAAYRKALSGDDVFRGSQYNDVLVGYAGDDKLSGRSGMDELRGLTGADYLDGGRDNDRLSGGGGRDLLRGNQGDDKLWGGADRDVFVFDRSDGDDQIADFVDGQDKIEIESGASRYRDLDIEQVGRHVEIAFDHTAILVRNADADDFTSRDFLFDL